MKLPVLCAWASKHIEAHHPDRIFVVHRSAAYTPLLLALAMQGWSPTGDTQVARRGDASIPNFYVDEFHPPQNPTAAPCAGGSAHPAP